MTQQIPRVSDLLVPPAGDADVARLPHARQAVTPPAEQVTEPAALSLLGVMTVLVGVFLVMLDFFIVNVALPTIGSTMHASPAALELVVAGYGIAYALLLVLGGRLGDALGRRRLFLTGMAAFGLTSLACGLAPTAGTLVAARAAQGMSAAMMVPQVLATIQAATAGHHRARALGLYGATGGIAAVAGQLLGGMLVSADIAGTSWRAIFLVNVPVVAVGLLLAVRIIPETRSANPARADLRGTVLLGAAVLTLLVPLMEGRAAGWPAWAWVMLALFPFAAGAFVAAERRLELAGHVPLVPPSLIREPSMRRGLLVGLPFFASFGGFMFIYAVALQQGVRLGPVEAGLAVVPMAVGFLVSSLASPRLVTRYGRRVLTAGALVQAVGLAALVLAVRADWPDLNPLNLALGMTLAGIGQGFVMTPLFRVVLSEVSAERAGVGSGVLVTSQQTSLALGVASLGTLFLSLSTAHGMDMGDAFVTILTLQVGVAGLVALLSRRLPDPSR
jgi:MFS family permease